MGVESIHTATCNSVFHIHRYTDDGSRPICIICVKNAANKFYKNTSIRMQLSILFVELTCLFYTNCHHYIDECEKHYCMPLCSTVNNRKMKLRTKLSLHSSKLPAPAVRINKLKPTLSANEENSFDNNN